MGNSADHSAASDLGMDCLQMPICPNAWGYYDNVCLKYCYMYGYYGNVFKILLYVWETVQTLIRRRIFQMPICPIAWGYYGNALNFSTLSVKLIWYKTKLYE